MHDNHDYDQEPRRLLRTSSSCESQASTEQQAATVRQVFHHIVVLANVTIILAIGIIILASVFIFLPSTSDSAKKKKKYEPGRRKCPLNMCLHFIFLEFRCLFKSYILMYILISNYNKLVVSTSNVGFPEIDQSNHNIHGIHLCFFFSGRSI